MTGTPTMTVRQVFSPEDADLVVKVVTDLDSATLDVAVTSVLRVDDSEDADELIRVVAGTIFPSTGPSHLLLDGSLGTYASTPDKPSLQLSGNRSARIAVACDDWLDGTFFYKETLGVDIVYYFGLDGGGNLDALVPNLQGGPPTPPTVTNGQLLGVRTDFIGEDGDGNAEHGFYTKPVTVATAMADISSETGWTFLGVFEFDNTGVIPTPVGDGPLVIGEIGPAARIYAAILRNELGTTVASPDFTAQPPGTTSFEDAQGNVWTVNGNAQIV